MTRKFAELEAKMSPESRLRVEEKVKETLAAMMLNEDTGISEELNKTETEPLYAGVI